MCNKPQTCFLTSRTPIFLQAAKKLSTFLLHLVEESFGCKKKKNVGVLFLNYNSSNNTSKITFLLETNCLSNRNTNYILSPNQSKKWNIVFKNYKLNLPLQEKVHVWRIRILVTHGWLYGTAPPRLSGSLEGHPPATPGIELLQFGPGSHLYLPLILFLFDVWDDVCVSLEPPLGLLHVGLWNSYLGCFDSLVGGWIDSNQIYFGLWLLKLGWQLGWMLFFDLPERSRTGGV